MKVIVVGNGMVGYKFCEKLVSKTTYKKENFEVTVFGEEMRPAYDRVHLSEYFLNNDARSLELANQDWYAENGIDLKLGELIKKIDIQNKTVESHKSEIYDFDKLIIATGSYPFVPTIEGVDKNGIFVYRTIEDLDQMIRFSEKIKSKGKNKAVVIGGGLLGLEAAKAVKDLGLETHIVEFASVLMARQLDARGGDVLKSKIEELGITVHTSKNTKCFAGEHDVEKMHFTDGSELDANMVVISAGIKARDEVASAAGLELGPRGGVLVDDKMQTSHPDIYAIGEVANFLGFTYGLVAPGYEMAEIVVSQLYGETKSMLESPDMSTKLKLLGVDVASFGDAIDIHHEHTPIIFENRHEKIYKRVNISADGTKLMGGILVGDAAEYNMLLQIYKNGMSLPKNPEDLILGSRNGAESLNDVSALPDAAVICSCENVNKGKICCAITDEGFDNYKAISKQTKAGTGCGGCKPMVQNILESELKKMGRVVKNTICEHFQYTRAELYDIVKIKGITDYDEALNTIGLGHGCESCKPALASIFASLFMETANKQPAIQDSNDRFLANIQRNGTYSVVPRIPGGEITPEKLIVIGEVAKEYNLYTKITGGQRIDLFGAQLNDLPAIWEKLIIAGFESGHAYGKALRTVKSCVGSTWCRFGMNDSVSLAVKIENRYKGLRAPHKLKGGVSGCIRECAEARGKDFGIIAVEGGLNLYVCGNGGADPKHAILLATGLDEETCIKYLDRFLMFYIQTAGPLIRTAPWLEKMEGGIEYLKSVVVDDSLGIGTELEAQMEKLVSDYACEWKEAIENDAIRKRYKHFINSEERDENIVFVPLREMKMPEPWK
ncbi:MAG TPA: nitrite reductase large subunit NirB [Saprospiraceae bacterium]|nr:nitrite reductase large subunit NirB [Saprospiraceae bacterium]